MNQSHPHPSEGVTGPRPNCSLTKNIYGADWILSPDSGYGIPKVVDMLNSERIRNLSPEIKRASVLMALGVAGTSTDDLLRDATRRQQALSSYDAGQQKQVEEFEARKAQEDAQIQAEMERVTAHYAERIQHNQDQVAPRERSIAQLASAKTIREPADCRSHRTVCQAASLDAASYQSGRRVTGPRRPRRTGKQRGRTSRILERSIAR